MVYLGSVTLTGPFWIEARPRAHGTGVPNVEVDHGHAVSGQPGFRERKFLKNPVAQ